MKLFVIKHKSGLFLKHQYVTTINKRSAVTLVDNEFPCFNSYDSAYQYIQEGNELFYSYNYEISINDLKIITLNQE